MGGCRDTQGVEESKGQASDSSAGAWSEDWLLSSSSGSGASGPTYSWRAKVVTSVLRQQAQKTAALEQESPPGFCSGSRRQADRSATWWPATSIASAGAGCVCVGG